MASKCMATKRSTEDENENELDLNMEGEDWDDWVEEDTDADASQGPQYQCLFCDESCKQKSVLLMHMQQVHAFDVELEIQQRHLDEYGTVRLVNYVRTMHVNGREDKDIVATLASAKFMEEERYLQPVVVNDPLLYCLECYDSEDEDDDEETKDEETSGVQRKQAATTDLAALVQQLQLENAALRQQVTKSTQLMQNLVVDDDNGAVKTGVVEPDNDTYYFDSYSQVGIHREMLSDRVRTESYRDAILKNRHLFEGKVVLDIGCGTGILSLFAAKAGAARVIGIDCSAMGDVAREIVAQNGFSDVITIIKGKVEDLELPVDKVDVIVSEWMGYCLLYEAMLDTVLFARDKWLKPQGHMLPDTCALFLQGADDSSKRLAFWDEVYGFDMKPMRAKISLRDAFVEDVPASDVLTDRVQLQDFDINTVKPEELDFRADFVLELQRPGTFHGFVASFDIGFDRDCESPVHFTTGVEKTTTHWHQVFFHVNEPFAVKTGDRIEGEWAMRRHPENPRFLDVDLSWKKPSDSKVTEQRFFIHD